jgi:hypothetical protein
VNGIQVLALTLLGIIVGGTIWSLKPKLLLAVIGGLLSFAFSAVVTGGNTVGVVVLLVVAIIGAIVVGARKELRKR